MYGGSTTSILVNIPGEAASVVTCIDGHQMAKQGPRRPGARHLRVRLLHRRHLCAGRADAGGAVTRQRRDRVRARRIFQPDGARPRGADLPDAGLDGEGAADGLHRRRARPDRARQHHRAAAPDLRPHGVDRRHRPRPRGDGPVRRRRSAAQHRAGDQARHHQRKDHAAVAEQGGLEGQRRPDGARHAARILPRHPAGRRRRDRVVCLLCAGEAAVENAGAFRPWRDRGRRGTGSRQQRRGRRRLHSADDARHPAERGDGAACSARSSFTACSPAR